MTYDVVLTRKAQRQIQAAARWWAEHRSAEQAQRWYQGLIETLSSLEENPQRCAMAPERDAFPLPLRQIPFGLGRRATHRAVFALRGARVVVYTVRHVAQRDLRPEDI